MDGTCSRDMVLDHGGAAESRACVSFRRVGLPCLIAITFYRSHLDRKKTQEDDDADDDENEDGVEEEDEDDGDDEEERRGLEKKQAHNEGLDEDEVADLTDPSHVKKKLNISDLGSREMTRKEKWVDRVVAGFGSC